MLEKVCLLSSCLRSLLAVLDYNHHNHQPDYITRKNEKSYKRLYSYIPELQRCILRKRMDGGALPRKAKRNPGDPRNLGNLAGVVAPPTAELVQTQIRRGQSDHLRLRQSPAVRDVAYIYMQAADGDIVPLLPAYKRKKTSTQTVLHKKKEDNYESQSQVENDSYQIGWSPANAAVLLSP